EEVAGWGAVTASILSGLTRVTGNAIHRATRGEVGEAMKIGRSTATSLLALLLACSSSQASSPPPGSQASTSPTHTRSPSVKIDPSSLFQGELFRVMPPGDWKGRFTKSEDARGERKLTIHIVALGDKPAFSPAVITGSPGQVLRVTVFQNDDLSSHFQHNFSIDALNINEDIPKGPGHSVTVTVKLPTSG